MSTHEDPDDENGGLILTISHDSTYSQQQKIPLRANNVVEMNEKQHTIPINDDEISTQPPKNKNQYKKIQSMINDDYKEEEEDSYNNKSEEKHSFNHDETSHLAIDYALNKKMNDIEINQYKTQIRQYFQEENMATKLNEVPAEQFSNDVINYCDKNKKLKTPLLELYELIEFKQIKS
eukprot:83653_1